MKNKNKIIRDFFEDLYEEKPFLIPNSDYDVPMVTLTYEDWLWLETFIKEKLDKIL